MTVFENVKFAEEGRYLEWGKVAAAKAQEMLDILAELEEDIEDLLPT